MPVSADRMLPRLTAQLHEIRLDLHGRWLRRQERAALRRLGEDVAAGPANDNTELRAILTEIAEARRQLGALAEERAASLQADRTDLRRVATWVQPVVIARGLCARAVLHYRAAAVHRRLLPLHEALGALAAEHGLGLKRREVVDARAGLACLTEEREQRLAPFGKTAHPEWMRRAGTEFVGLARAVMRQLRSTLMPKVPALAGLVVGWWIANTYTDSHVRSALRSLGIGHGGTHVVSGSTYKAMSFWLPLLAAAVCAYLGERLAESYRKRVRGTPVDSRGGRNHS
jgi:hypothetical protein